MNEDEPDQHLPIEEPREGEPRNVADPRKIESEARRIRRYKREGEEFWRGVFASEIGRREMWTILQAGHWSETKFACGPNGFPQPEATWFAAGEQALAQRLHDSWDIIDHEGVHLMKREHDPRYPKPIKKGGG